MNARDYENWNFEKSHLEYIKSSVRFHSGVVSVKEMRSAILGTFPDLRTVSKSTL